jgi:uncharacterized membrane protein
MITFDFLEIKTNNKQISEDEKEELYNIPYAKLLNLLLKIQILDSSNLIDSREFEELATTFVSYITTFIIIGIYWITYHSIFNPIRHTTDLMIWLNLSFLLFIVIIPFSVRLIDKYYNQNSLIFYSLT